MFKRHLVLKLALVALIIVLGAGLVASAAAGDSSDPLISLSYINETVIPALTSRLESLVGSAKSELSSSFDNTLEQFRQSLNTEYASNAIDSDSSSDYKTVDLSDGQSVSLESGCEILFVSGSGVCVGSLTDTTSGSVVDNSQMEENHLYLCTGAASIVADGQAQLLIKGSFTVK